MCARAKKLNGTLDIDSVFMAFFCLEWIDFVSSPSTMAVQRFTSGIRPHGQQEECFIPIGKDQSLSTRRGDDRSAF
jgi:hypothetical protein